MNDYHLINGSNLAYIGDAYFELMIRLHLLDKGITKSKDLNKIAINYVSAHAHQLIFDAISEKFTDEELQIFKRGRNSASSNYRKNMDQGEYATSSGLEAIIGYLYLKKDFVRLSEIIGQAIEAIEGKK